MTERIEKCPMCGKATAEKFKPFCSARCRTIDLGKWLGEGYRLPTDEIPDESEPFPVAKQGEEDE